MNILIDIQDIQTIGGVERFVATLANAMEQRGHNVYCFTYMSKNTIPHFNLKPSIHVIHYHHSGAQKHVTLLRQQVLACKPDVFLSPSWQNSHLLWCATLAGTGIPLVYSEHNDPWIIEKEYWNQEERDIALCMADRIHLILDRYRKSVPEVARQKICVIPYPIGIEFRQQRQEFNKSDAKSQHVLLSLGRLSENQKQVSLLIRAFAILSPEFPTWRLDIWGQGRDYEVLKSEILHLNLQSYAHLRGPTNSPQEQYATADIFCIPSRYEGLPNTVIEAMAHSLPVVGFTECTALNELIECGKTGFLAPEMTAESLAATLRPLMVNASLRHKMGKMACKSAEQFTPERIFDAWEALLAEAAACKGHTHLRECIQGNVGISNLAPYYAKMRELLSKNNILLQESQYITKYYQQFPILKNIPQPIRHMFKAMVKKLGL